MSVRCAFSRNMPLLACCVILGCGHPVTETIKLEPPDPSLTFAANDLSEADRSRFYHLDEGSELFPLDVLKEAKQPESDKPFLSNLERFGLISDPRGPDNPEGLAVGITAAPRKGVEGIGNMLGVNCASCHVGQLEYRGKKIRVDGAPNLFDVFRFYAEAADAIQTSVLADPTKFLSRYRRGSIITSVSRLAGFSNSEVELISFGRRTWQDFTANPGVFLSYLQLVVGLQDMRRGQVVPGYGRADAFGTARFQIFGDKVPLTAPSSFPWIWELQRTNWYHHISNTNSIVERNIGQALGLGGSFDPVGLDTTVNLEHLHQLETLAGKLKPPSWPAALPSISAERAREGKPIYEKNCAGCHEKYASDASSKLRDFQLWPIASVGTDDAEARNWVRPVVLHGQQLGLAAAHELVIGAIRDAYVKRHKISPAQQLEWNGGRPEQHWRWNSYADTNGFRMYPSRPLAGVWATSPFLHNGSVPTLCDLLQPPEKRPKVFYTGSREYDPISLGYLSAAERPADSECAEPEGNLDKDKLFKFDTTIPGNGNGGHVYGAKLTKNEKMALLEYLKTVNANP